jgi:poly(A) polymerase
MIPFSDHGISRTQICPNAANIIARLEKAGYQAYLVGGAIRDLLLGKQPKDFDVATNATPQQIEKLFNRCRRIGRRFQLVHVYFGRKFIEVSTFRAASEPARTHPDRITDNGVIVRDNVYGTAREDALRRDFSINALFYNLNDEAIIDYCDGYRDLQEKTLRTIGPAGRRFEEDPVRILRALRFQAKLGVSLSTDIIEAIESKSTDLKKIPPARLLDECLKIFHGGNAVQCWNLLQKFKLTGLLFPALENSLKIRPDHEQLILLSLENTDLRIREGKPLNPAFIMAVLLWPVLQARLKRHSGGKNRSQALQSCAPQIIRDQAAHVAITKRMAAIIIEIWLLQQRFKFRQGKRCLRLLQHPRFRAAYDFMCLRSKSGELDPGICRWWTDIQSVGPEQQKAMLMASSSTDAVKDFAFEN